MKVLEKLRAGVIFGRAVFENFAELKYIFTNTILQRGIIYLLLLLHIIYFL